MIYAIAADAGAVAGPAQIRAALGGVVAALGRRVCQPGAVGGLAARANYAANRKREVRKCVY